MTDPVASNEPTNQVQTVSAFERLFSLRPLPSGHTVCKSCNSTVEPKPYLRGWYECKNCNSLTQAVEFRPFNLFANINCA